MPAIAAIGGFLGTAGGAAVASGVIGAAGSMYAANQENKGVQRGIDAQQQATQQSLALQKQMFDQTRQDQAPFRQAGLSGIDAILADYGLGQPQAGGKDWGEYLTRYTDVAQEYQRLQSTPEGRAQLQATGVTTPEQFAEYHATVVAPSLGENRTVNTIQASEQPATAEQRLQERIGEEPDYGERQEYQRPGYVAPNVSLNAFEASPDYQFRLNEGSRNLNAFNAAKGVTGSGAAAKALIGYGQNLAAGEYDKFFGRQLGLTDRQNAFNQGSFESDRQYGTGVYDADRGFSAGRFDTNRLYQTGRADTRTNDLFRLAGIGQGATNVTNQAGQNYAGAAQNQYNTNANVLGNAYGQIGQNNAGLAGQMTGYAQNIFANWQKPAGGNAGTSWSPNWGGGS